MITINEQEFKELTDYVKSNYGINLSKKKIMVEGRLSNIIFEKGFKSFGEYFDFLYRNKTGNEMVTLVNRLTTNHTYFMREKSHFQFYRDVVLPYIEKNERSHDVRVWSAGCATGEEPYTLAMLNLDFFALKKEIWNTEILATDISVHALETAQKGNYSAENIGTIPPTWRSCYFKKTQNGYEVADRLRKEVTFRVFNLMEKKFPFRKKFQAIFCRNVMIYFDEETKNRLVQKFYDCTEPGGYLFIGHSEFIDRDLTAYRYIMPAVYRKE